MGRQRNNYGVQYRNMNESVEEENMKNLIDNDTWNIHISILDVVCWLLGGIVVFGGITYSICRLL